MSAAAELLRAPAIDLLRRLIEAAGWRGEERGLIHAAPHVAPMLDAADMIATLENLGVPHIAAEGRLDRLASGDCPCLLIDHAGRCEIAFAARDGAALLLAPGETEPAWRKPPAGRGTVVRVLSTREGEPFRVRAVADLFVGSRRAIGSLLLATLFTNLLAFAPPILVMAIYDRAIPVGEPGFILELVEAMGMVLVADAALRAIRARVAAELGARLETGLALALFRKLAAMPMAQIEKAGVHEQLLRLKQFEKLRDIFSGSLFIALLDLPFIALFLAAILFLAPTIGLMLICVAAIYVAAALIVSPARNRRNLAASQSRAAHQKVLHEIASSQLAIQRLGAEEIWAARADRLAARAAADARRARTGSLVAQAFGQSLMMAAGVGVVGFGTAQAIAGDLSFGGLIAVMAMVWRFLAPVQALYGASAQLESFVKSRRRADKMLQMEEEFSRAGASSRLKTFTGKLAVVNVSHRFSAAMDPALAGISFTLEPGELAIICGNGGAGKSTLLSIVARLYTPTVGAVQLDGIDYRQIPTEELRGAISYDLQSPEFLHGTIRQNFHMAHPAASEEEIWALLDRLHLGEEIRRMPEGLDTRLTEATLKRLSQAMIKGLSLARALIRPAPIYLFSEPCIGLDNAHEHAFLDVIRGMKGHRTVLMVTNRPSHFELADRLILLDRCRAVVNERGPAARRKVAAYQAHLQGR